MTLGRICILIWINSKYVVFVNHILFFLDKTRSIWKLIFLDKIHLGVFKLMHWVILGENLIFGLFWGDMCHGRTFPERSQSTKSESLPYFGVWPPHPKLFFFFEKYMVWPVYICYQIMFRCLGSLVLPWGLFFERTFNLHSISGWTRIWNLVLNICSMFGILHTLLQ